MSSDKSKDKKQEKEANKPEKSKASIRRTENDKSR